ncbi:MFS transporter [Cellvibrio sp. KY-GH-1]|uniref:MFS transporter n=1 Tax=Cellvibrio sp. KY-GH-1 TaxID=2303332 RepID=UPI001243C4BE|nr:MFS transporter [Cellvibrio sp. KY-GH-1]QEY17828.1 MFS transporter [Cellvibrio sp. KY-GH-1]
MTTSSTMNPQRLFTACCIALIVTAMTFAIRAGILTELSVKFNFNNTELGWINGMAFFGFPIAMLFGGFIYNYVGARTLMYLAFACHLLGLILTITAGGFWTLLLSSFFIGFANGSVEAACNPLIADIYHTRKTAMLNKFHVWFPGGIVIGSLVSALMTKLGLGWQLQIAIMIIPTFVYGAMIFGQTFPKMENSETSTAANVKALISPLFLFMMFCMTMTAISEFGAQQWVGRIFESSDVHPMMVLALTAGLMALGRFFAGPLVHAFNPAGVLVISAVVTTIGLVLLSQASGYMIYVSAAVFALGVTYFWPTMIGFTSEYTAKTGALGMSLMGGAGMFSVFVWNPVIGSWLDAAKKEAIDSGVTGDAVELVAGQATLQSLAMIPGVLIIAFGVLFLLRKRFAH